jgi:hypothetical protein
MTPSELNDAYVRRVQQIRSLNELFSELGTRPEPLTPEEQHQLLGALEAIKAAVIDALNLKRQLTHIA